MNPYYCPVEDCDYGDGEDRSFRSVRSHINATSDAEHNWTDLKPVVEAQTDQEEADDELEGEEEQPEASESSASEPDESTPEEGEMPTKAEYEQQRSQTTEESSDEASEKGAESGDSESSTDQASSTPSTPSFPLTDRTLLLLAGVVVAGVLLYTLYLDDSEDSTTYTEGSDDTPDQDETTPEGSDEQEALWE